jgi:hypothetical protein
MILVIVPHPFRQAFVAKMATADIQHCLAGNRAESFEEEPRPSASVI